MTSSGATVYSFGDFRLNALARELSRDGEPIELAASAFDCLVYLIEHRERPVGKDELISAVWGRADVSDNLLAQTIVRLRRTLGDAGNEQSCIRTVPRVGYRWMLETLVLQQTPAHPEVAPTTAHDAREGETAVRSRWKSLPVRPPLLIALVCMLVLGLVYAGWQVLSSRVAKTNFQFNRSAAVVLPVDVRAPDDWKWLHLGMMDMIASRLRDAKVPTESSQSVLELLGNNDNASGAKLSSFALVVQPRVELAGDHWRVHLDARSQDGRTWKAEASSSDVMAAAHMASDLLLAQLGYSSGNSSASPGGSVELYLQRIDAARLAGQPQAARELIEQAPPELRNNHEMAYMQASLDCDEAKMDACQQKLEALLKQLTDNREPVLRGEILTILGSIYSAQERWAESSAALDEAVRTLQGQKNFAALASSYLNRAQVSEVLWKLEEATADIGRARFNYAVAGDLVGVAKSDFSMGTLALRRSQPEAALILLQHAYDQFVSMGMRSMLLSTLDGLAYAQQMLLKFPEELATTDRFWPLEEKSGDFGFIGDDMRRELTMVRAAALADNGRTGDAKTLMERAVSEADPEKEASLRAQLNRSLARLALERGDNERAVALTTRALTPTLEQDDQRDYAETWLIRISALQRIGKTDEARRDIAAMLAWESRLPVKTDWTHIYVLRAMAAQAWIEGNRDKALEQFKLAMNLADKLGVPEVIVSAGKAYALALLDTGHVEEAAAVSGRLSAWSQVDWRAAWVEARVYQALGQTDSWEKSRGKAQRLAGDRPLPTAAKAVEF